MAGEDETKKDTKSSNQTPAYMGKLKPCALPSPFRSTRRSPCVASFGGRQLCRMETVHDLCLDNQEQDRVCQWNPTLSSVQRGREDAVDSLQRLGEKLAGKLNEQTDPEISCALQGCEKWNSVTSFFTNLKALWDEKDALCTSTPCTCAAATEAATALETQRTMKFLMGLNDDYAAVICYGVATRKASSSVGK
ncbi:hypothetical protein ACLB2K_062477 [Fragaria x ananassa]